MLAAVLEAVRIWYARRVERGWFSDTSNEVGIGLVSLIAGISIGRSGWSQDRVEQTALGTLIVCAGLLGLVRGLRNVRRQSWIRRNGIECWGSVLEVT